MTSIFEQSLKPPSGGAIGQTLDDRGVDISLEYLSFMQQLWSWVASGYVTIPCDVSGTANAIQLTPRFRSEIGGSGYAHLLGFSFVAASTSTGAATISVIGEILTKRSASPATTFALATIPVYIAASAAGAGDIVAGVPYIAIYCDAVTSPSLPARMVLK